MGATFPKKYDMEDIFAQIDRDGDITVSKDEYGKLTKNLKALIESTGISLLYRKNLN